MFQIVWIRSKCLLKKPILCIRKLFQDLWSLSSNQRPSRVIWLKSQPVSQAKTWCKWTSKRTLHKAVVALDRLNKLMKGPLRGRMHNSQPMKLFLSIKMKTCSTSRAISSMTKIILKGKKRMSQTSLNLSKLQLSLQVRKTQLQPARRTWLNLLSKPPCQNNPNSFSSKKLIKRQMHLTSFQMMMKMLPKRSEKWQKAKTIIAKFSSFQQCFAQPTIILLKNFKNFFQLKK